MAARCPSLSLTVTALTLHLAVGSAKSQWLEQDRRANQLVNSCRIYCSLDSSTFSCPSFPACITEVKTQTLDNFSRSKERAAHVGGKYDDHLPKIWFS